LRTPGELVANRPQQPLADSGSHRDAPLANDSRNSFRVQRVGILGKYGNRSFGDTGGYSTFAESLVNHESAKTPKLYDRKDDKLSLDEVERITI